MDISQDDYYTNCPLAYWELHDLKLFVSSILDTVYTRRNETNVALANNDFTGECAGDEYADTCLTFVLENVACSNIAVAALAPLFESLFAKAIARFREFMKGLKPTRHLRSELSDDDFWNPYVVATSTGQQKNVLDGFKQLMVTLGFERAICDELWRVLHALFAYRNKALHGGYEWLVDDRKALMGNIQRNHWDEWFFVQKDERGNPWLIWMTDAFIKRVFLALEQLAGILFELTLRLRGS